MSIESSVNNTINKLQEILEDVMRDYPSGGLILPGVIVAIAQHRVNLYLSSIGVNAFIMVDCDHTGTLFLNTLE